MLLICGAAKIASRMCHTHHNICPGSNAYGVALARLLWDVAHTPLQSRDQQQDKSQKHTRHADSIWPDAPPGQSHSHTVWAPAEQLLLETMNELVERATLAQPPNHSSTG